MNSVKVKILSIKKIERKRICDITVKDVHEFLLKNGTISHNSLYPKAIVSGGQGIMLSANTVFIITKAQEKDGTELAGFKFTINIEKSRFVKEKAKLPFTVLYDTGVQKWSSLFDLALESGHITKAKMGWYNLVNMETGEVVEPSRREKSINNDDAFFETLIKDEKFKTYVENKFKLSSDMNSKSSDIDEEEDEDDLE